jgi:hypothetical protein
MEGQSVREPGHETLVRSISPQYFATLSIPILRGRDLTDQDTADRPRVAVVNQAFVDRVFHGENPLGRRVSVFWGAQAVAEIVGVVGNVRYTNLAKEEGSTLYWPEAHRDRGGRDASDRESTVRIGADRLADIRRRRVPADRRDARRRQPAGASSRARRSDGSIARVSAAARAAPREPRGG